MRKNWKILLPLCTVASAGAILAPCLTSCSNDGKWTDLSEWHPDASTQHKEEQLTVEKAANALFDADDSIIKQDILNSYKTAIEEEPAEWVNILKTLGVFVGEVEEDKCSVSGFKEFDHKTDEGTATISGTIKLKFSCIMLESEGSDKDIGTYSIEIKNEVKKLPYKIQYSSNWEVAQGDLANKEWSSTLSYSSTASYYDPKKPNEEQSRSNTYYWYNVGSLDEDEVNQFLFNMVFWGKSYYLEKCTQ